jgi:phage tail tape-measure protein
MKLKQVAARVMAVNLAGLIFMVAANGAEAKGCIKGAAVGAVAGHVAGHHAVVGAAAGCVVGHHLAKKKQQEDWRQRHEQPQSAPAPPRALPPPQTSSGQSVST